MSGSIAGNDVQVAGTITITKNPVGSVYSTTTTVTETFGTVIVNTSSVITLTIPSPASGTDDGKILTLLSINGSGNVTLSGTFESKNQGTLSSVSFSSFGQILQLLAYNGAWYVLTNNNQTSE